MPVHAVSLATIQGDILLIYPSITKEIVKSPVYAFDKLDGSNIRVEWSRKNGFAKYGTRTRLLDKNETPLGEAVSIFEEEFASPLTPVLKSLRVERVTLFLEFYGQNSFAGYHEDEKHFLSLFDASLFKKGFMLPKQFMSTFVDVVPTAPLLCHGNANAEFVEDVKAGTLEGMTFEGVVCESQELVRNRQVKFKVKNQAWLDKLKTHCGDDLSLFEKLA